MKPLSKVILLFVIIVIAGSIVYWFFAVKPSLPSNNNEQQSIASSETANWATYKNEQYGFEFKYPAEWGKLLEQPIQNTLHITFFIPQSHVTFEVSVIPSDGPTPNKSEREIWEDLYGGFNEQNKARVTREIKRVGNREVLKLTTANPMPVYEPVESLMVLNPEKTIIITLGTIVQKDPPNLELAPKLELIASTLVFQ